MCRNSFIKKEDETGGEEQHNDDHGHDMIMMNMTRKKMTSWMIAIYCGNLDVNSNIYNCCMSFFNIILNYVNKFMQ